MENLTLKVCAVRKDDGTIEVYNTGVDRAFQPDGVIAYKEIDCQPLDQPDEVKTALRILHDMSCLDDTLQAMNYLFQEVFMLGRNSVS